MDKLIELIAAHYIAIGCVIAYVLLTVVNQMAPPGVPAGGVYGLFYRTMKSLAASPMATGFEARIENKFGIPAGPGTVVATVNKV